MVENRKRSMDVAQPVFFKAWRRAVVASIMMRSKGGEIESEESQKAAAPTKPTLLEMFSAGNFSLGHVHSILEFLAVRDMSMLLRCSKDLYSIRLSSGNSTYSTATGIVSSSIVADRIMAIFVEKIATVAMAQKIKLPPTFNMREMSKIERILDGHPCCSKFDELLRFGLIANPLGLAIYASVRNVEHEGEFVKEDACELQYAISKITDCWLHLEAIKVCSCCDKLSVCGGWCGECRKYTCMKSHKRCASCSKVLNSCADALACSVCSLNICLECSIFCDLCAVPFCNKPFDECGDVCLCDICGTAACVDCNDMNMCESCMKYICTDHDDFISYCDDCGKIICNDCKDLDGKIEYCEICQALFCYRCRDTYYCEYCSKVTCSFKHEDVSFEVCDLCQILSCDSCGKFKKCEQCELVYCETCREIKAAGKEESGHDDGVSFTVRSGDCSACGMIK